VLGLFACVVGATQKRLIKCEIALKITSKNPFDILLKFIFSYLKLRTRASGARLSLTLRARASGPRLSLNTA